MVVLIDALRASVTIVCALHAGAERVIPVLDTEDALRLRVEEKCLVAGERGGAKVPGFDFGNSPNEVLSHGDRLRGRTLVLTTSNGTRCLHAALELGAPLVLAGALPNAGSAVRAALDLAERQKRDVTLLGAGLDDVETDEDAFAVRLMAGRMVGDGRLAPEREGTQALDERLSRQVFLGSEAGGRLSRLGYENDVLYCSRIDTLDTVPIYIPGVGFVSLTPQLEIPYLKGEPRT